MSSQPQKLVIVQDIYGDMVLGRPFRPVGEAEQSAVLVKGFSPHDGSVPDLHADPVSGLQFVNTFKGHAHPSTPVNVMDVDDSPGRHLGATSARSRGAGDFETGASVSALPGAGHSSGEAGVVAVPTW